MKKNFEPLIFFSILMVLLSCNSSIEKKNNNFKKNHKGFIIEGILAKSENAKFIYLVDKNDKKIDSTPIKKHSFSFIGSVKKPDKYFLQTQNSSTKHAIVLENNSYKMLLDENKAMIIGGKLHTLFNTYRAKKEVYNHQKAEVLEQFSKLDLGLRPYLKYVDSIRKIEKILFDDFIINHHENVLSSLILSDKKLSSKEAIKLKNKLKVKDSKSLLINKLNRIINAAKIVEAEEKILRRKPVPLFSGVNLKGRQTSLENIIKGKKLFLIDFWASWCPPCREMSPKLKELYQQYKRKGFDILTVSEDRSVDEWKNGVFIDDIEAWHHIYDDFNRISSMFGVGALPHMVLIDENGKIIKNNISLSSLEDQLEKVFEKE